MLYKLVKKIFGYKELFFLWRKMYLYSLRGMNIGFTDDMSKNGEEFVLKKLKLSTDKPVFFDVGANTGKWTRLAIKYFPDAVIHAFEPQREAFLILSEAFKKNHNIQCYNTALGKQSGVGTLHKNSDLSEMASLTKIDISHRKFHDEFNENCEVETLYKVLQTNRIDNIDYLKIDVEGHEIDVLLGGLEAIKKGVPKVIQFEFGKCHLSTHTTFFDIFNLLSGEYRIYLLLRNGFIEVKRYSVEWEVFDTTNFLGVHKSNLNLLF